MGLHPAAAWDSVSQGPILAVVLTLAAESTAFVVVRSAASSDFVGFGSRRGAAGFTLAAGAGARTASVAFCLGSSFAWNSPGRLPRGRSC